MAVTGQQHAKRRDERVREIGFAHQALRRPELGAAAGCVLVLLFFAVFAGDTGLFSARGTINFLEVSAQLGILAVAVCLLMIGGEFDLSIGSMIAFAGVIIAIPSTVLGWPIWTCVLLAFGAGEAPELRIVTEAGGLGLVPPATPPIPVAVAGDAPVAPDVTSTTLEGWADVKPTLGDQD